MKNKSSFSDVENNFFKMQTCSERRLNKIKNIIHVSRKIICKDLSKLEETDITKFLRNINNSAYTQWTKNDYKKIFKAFLRWYYKSKFLTWMEDKLIKDGFKSVSKGKAFNKSKINKDTLIKSEELELMLRTAKSLKWKALLSLMYESAFRPCEVKMLRWSDLNFNDAKNICSVKTISPKTGEMREVPVQDCIVHLKRWRAEYQFLNVKDKDFVFPSQFERDKPMGDGVIHEMFKRICADAKMRNIYPYILRHSRIYFIQKRLGARIAAKYAGHSLETSEIYDHLDSKDVEEAMLEKVYTTKELTPEQKSEYEERLKKLEYDNLMLHKTIKALGWEEISNTDDKTTS
jgi:integrase